MQRMGIMKRELNTEKVCRICGQLFCSMYKSQGGKASCSKWRQAHVKDMDNKRKRELRHGRN
jgi:hypothetical protein